VVFHTLPNPPAAALNVSAILLDVRLAGLAHIAAGRLGGASASRE